MRLPTKLVLLASSLTLGTGLAAKPAANEMVPAVPELAASVDMERAALARDIAAILKERGVEGAHVVVTMGPDTFFARSYGVDPSQNSPFSGSTKVRLASASKLLTGLTVATLRQNNALSLDDTFGDVVPDAPAEWRAIPVWRILNHTSGLPMVVSREDFNAMSKDDLSNFTLADLLEMIGEEPLDFEPGENWRYQQSGYAVLANALAQRSGVRWTDLVQSAIITPANLTRTGYGNDAAVFDVEEGQLVPHSFFYPELFSPAGGFQTTGDDARRLLIALASGRILNEDSLRALVNDADRLEPLPGDAQGEGYGPGVTVQRFGEVAFFGHSGGGGLADIRFAPERQLGIAVLTNRAGGTGAAIEVADLIAERLAGEAQTSGE